MGIAELHANYASHQWKVGIRNQNRFLRIPSLSITEARMEDLPLSSKVSKPTMSLQKERPEVRRARSFPKYLIPVLVAV